MRHRSGAVVVIAVVLSACTPGPAEPQDKITHNGLMLGVLKTALPDLRAEARGPLHQGVLGRSQAGLILLEYVDMCALDLGLARSWLDGPLGTEEGRWVSACLLAHINADGTQVPLSARGPHPALEPSPEVRRDFGLQEAAFFGDLFGVLDERFACIGEGFSEEIGDPESWLHVRLCAYSDECEIDLSGFCAGLCDASSGGAWSECNSWEDFDLATGDFRRYREVVTIYLPEQD